MKKSIAAILSLVMIASLCACSQDETEPRGTTSGSAYACHVPATCDTLEMYDQWISLAKDIPDSFIIPDNFIYYDYLENWGEFESFQWYWRLMESGESCLMNATYWVIDANNISCLVQLKYVPIYQTQYGETLAFDETVTDMRTHPAGVFGTVYRDGGEYEIRYIYGVKGLKHIVFMIDDLQITLSGSPLAEYPISDKNTFFDRLLSTDLEVASAVVEELAAKLAQ